MVLSVGAPPVRGGWYWVKQRATTESTFGSLNWWDRSDNFQGIGEVQKYGWRDGSQLTCPSQPSTCPEDLAPNFTQAAWSFGGSVYSTLGVVITYPTVHIENLQNGFYLFELVLQCSGIPKHTAQLAIHSGLDGSSHIYDVEAVLFSDPWWIFQFTTANQQPAGWEGGPFYVRLH